MILKLIPRALIVCACTFNVLTAFAQTPNSRGQQLKPFYGIGEPAYIKNDDPVIVSVAEPVSSGFAGELKSVGGLSSNGVLTLSMLQPLLASAIDHRLGARYRWGSEGPYTFDCSGFVWSTFQSAGIDFERGSARTLWGRFEAPPADENFKYGTLVFFSHLAHIGIVADEKGFYHASRHHGVVYAPFNDYWLKRIDGFRRVTLPASIPAQAVAKKLEAEQ
jgi:NlpC/P60 family